MMPYDLTTGQGLTVQKRVNSQLIRANFGYGLKFARITYRLIATAGYQNPHQSAFRQSHAGLTTSILKMTQSLKCTRQESSL